MTEMNHQNNQAISSISYQGRNSFARVVSPTLLFASAITLSIGYSMHLTGFFGWLTLVIAGASLFAAGTVWGDMRRFSLLAAGVAVVGAALCLFALPAQLHANATGAAVMNFGVIFCQLAAFILIVHNITSSREMPLHRI